MNLIVNIKAIANDVCKIISKSISTQAEKSCPMEELGHHLHDWHDGKVTLMIRLRSVTENRIQGSPGYKYNF